MELEVIRSEPILPVAQPGEMLLNGTHYCWTLESYLDRIPPGRYQITLHPSPRFGRIMPLLQDVPERSYIEIHWGTYPENYQGCIGVGEAHDTDTGDIFGTRDQWNDLFPIVEAAVRSEGCWITVSDLR